MAEDEITAELEAASKEAEKVGLTLPILFAPQLTVL
jgi:hypothetical protein